MSQTTTNVGRAQFADPDLGYDTLDGGTALQAQLRANWTKVANDLAFRYGAGTVANSGTLVVAHNFGLNLSKLKVYIFEAGVQLTAAQIAAGYTVAETGGSSTTSVTVTNNTGSSKALIVQVLSHKLGVVAADLDPAIDIDTTGNVRGVEVRTTGNDLVLNHDAAGSGADWKGTLRRPSSGMTADAVWTGPASTGTLATLARTEAFTNKDYDGGTASNTSRITLPSATKATLDGLTRKAGTLVYGTNTTKAYLDNGTTLLQLAGGGGGGGGGTWNQYPQASPGLTDFAGEKAFLFSRADRGTQKLIMFVKVPQSYTAGTQILMSVGGCSASTSGTVGYTTVSYLVRTGTDAADSTTNSNSDTQSVTNASPANNFREFVMQITDTSGLINGVAVAAGHMIRIELQRDSSDTDTADTYFFPSSTDMRVS